MNQYKFTKPNISRSFKKEYATLEEAQAFADSYDGGGWNIEDLGAVPQKSPEELYKSDRAFLKQLFDNFNIKNRSQQQTPAEMVELQQAFGNIALLADAGSINFVRGSIAALTPPIGGVYTAERQAEDLADIDNYLATRLYS
jgi:hypothetical protein